MLFYVSFRPKLAPAQASESETGPWFWSGFSKSTEFNDQQKDTIEVTLARFFSVQIVVWFSYHWGHRFISKWLSWSSYHPFNQSQWLPVAAPLIFYGALGGCMTSNPAIGFHGWDVVSWYPIFPWLRFTPARWWGEPQGEASWCEKAGHLQNDIPFDTISVIEIWNYPHAE